MDIYIVLPAYNEEKSVGKVIKALKAADYNNIIVVDDGSTDRTSLVAERAGAEVYRHIVNRGLGGALGTGLKIAVEKGADIAVTFDSDGQHAVEDIPRVIRPIVRGKCDVVIGSRLKNPEGMPLIRRMGNWGFNLITLLLFNVWTTDSQSGFRAFSYAAASRIEIKANRMEVSSDIIREVGRNRLKLKEVPIKAIYTDYSMRKGQSTLNAINILIKLIIKKLTK